MIENLLQLEGILIRALKFELFKKEGGKTFCLFHSVQIFSPQIFHSASRDIFLFVNHEV